MAINPHGPLPLISFDTIMREPLPQVDWLVGSLVAQGDRVIVYGEFRSMKSWLLLHLGLHLAAGKPWLAKFPISSARRVLFIDEEMNERTLRRRVKRLGLGAGLEGPIPFQAMSRVGVRFDATGAANLLAALDKTQFDPEVIVVETFRRVLVGSENESDDVSTFWNHVTPILRAGKTLIVTHHMRKPRTKSEAQGGGGRNRERASGSTDILAGTDAAFAVQRPEGSSAVIVECVKSRESEEEGRFVVRLQDDGRDSPVELVYDGSPQQSQAETRKATQAIDMVVECLNNQPGKTAASATILEYLSANSIAQRTGQRALAEAKKAGRIQQPERGQWRLIVDQEAA
jgi:hypothetical protein